MAKQEKELTGWISGDLKPTRVGVYERDDSGTLMYDGQAGYSKWEKGQWMTTSITVEGAAKHFGCPSAYQSLPWRGLARRPR